MLKNVQITEKSSGRIIAVYPIVIEIVDASEEEYCDEAWENAIDEGLVDPETRQDYEIEAIEEYLVRTES